MKRKESKQLDQVMKYYEVCGLNYDEERKAWLEQECKKAVSTSPFKIVVLDDDPTGVQSVHHVSVFTDWSIKWIQKGFLSENKMFFILTNSRALTKEETTKLHKEIAHNVSEVSKEYNIPFIIINRSDSTLRGHFPLETKVLKEVLEVELNCMMDGEILLPFFEAGGRVTIDNIHYVKYGNELVPAAETEFAKDKTFGYEHSNLCEYIEEKTKGYNKAEDVITISLEELRGLKLTQMEEKLLHAKKFQKIVVNALCKDDLNVFVLVLYKVLSKGKRFLYRTAADFVKAVGAISNQPLLLKEQMVNEESVQGGLIVVGSHTNKTTAQLNALKDIKGLEFLEMDTDAVLSGTLQEEVARVIVACEKKIKNGVTLVVYTKRTLLTLPDDTKEQALLRSVAISDAVAKVVGELTVQPSFIIAKGGITSSDIGVKALVVKEAMVLGQVQPGIPVWKADKESKFPGIPYIIFPGNVGEDDTLRNVVLELVRQKGDAL